jgi:ribosomal protein S18 acetylase RimI-like enzyme
MSQRRQSRSALKQLGVNFTEVLQDKLSDVDPLKQLSSPSILNNGELVVGTKTGGGGCSIAVPGLDGLRRVLGTVRSAAPSDMTSVYMMGFEVWAEGESHSEYLKGCFSSTKYMRGKWYVLEGPNGDLLSSLITYSFDSQLSGIGSIATVPSMRNKGYATYLTQTVLEHLKGNGVATVFLYSDINPKLYENFGFEALPRRFQKYEKSLCMAWGRKLMNC